MKKAEITVQLIDYMGSDVSVVNAARISFDKIKDEFDEQDERLVNYLAEHNHWSPFAHTSIQVRVFQLTAARRRLVADKIGGFNVESISTHSRAKAAGALFYLCGWC